MKGLLRILDQQGISLAILVASDIFWYFLSFFAAYYVRNNYGLSEIQPFHFYMPVMPFVLMLLIFNFYSYGLYEQKNRIRHFSEIVLVTKAASFNLLLIMAASFLDKVDYSRGLVLLFWPMSIIFLNFGRYIIRQVKRKLLKSGYGATRVLIIGAGKPGRRLARKLEEYEDFGYRIVGFLDDQVKPRKGKYKFLGMTKDLQEVIKKRNIMLVFVSDPAISHEKILEMIQMCENTPVKFKVVSDLFEIIAGGIDINELEEIPAIDLKKGGPSIFYAPLKRLTDIGISLAGLVVFLPFWLIIAMMITLDSKGPIFFKQRRIGQFENPFTVYKFRTMHKDANPDEFSPRDASDKRITRIGKWLRHTSLDEFPQLWNVLKGEMSIVGPRPEMPFIVKNYKDWQKRRLEVKPGITGLWQVLGRKDLPLEENIEYDFYYIKNRSMLLDFVIIFKTILVVLRGKGAY